MEEHIMLWSFGSNRGNLSNMDATPIELKRPHRGSSALLWSFENKIWGSAKSEKQDSKSFSHGRRLSYQMARSSSPPPGRAPVSLGPSSVAEISPAQPPGVHG